MSEGAEFHGPWWRYPVLQAALASGLISSTAFALAHLGFVSEGVETGLYVLAIPLGAYHWAREALEELVREREIGIDLLMLAALAGSSLLGLFDEAAFLAFLYAAAEGLEEYTYARTRAAIRSLLDLAPKQARVIRDGREMMVPAEELSLGDIFVVRPGEAVPTDGVIRQGESSLDESPVTGESVPVDKGIGEKVFAGTFNRQGALEVEATAAFSDNSLQKIIHLVETAQEQKGRAQQWIERFGRRYSPGVLALSAALVLVPLLFGFPFGEWAHRAVVLLVAAAPCALVMSMPVAMAAGIGRAGRRGILIKGGAHLEHLGRVRAIAFDKTGTLTEGKPRVADVVPLGASLEELLSTAAALEHFSEHPLARAIVEHASMQGIAPSAADGFQALTGAGVSGRVGGKPAYVASPNYARVHGALPEEAARTIAELEELGKTTVVVAQSERLLGVITIEDSPRAEARETLSRLQAAGCHLVMLTGDNERTARSIAARLGIENVRAELKPEDKVAAVRELAVRFPGGVLMVGDGINDAPALASATCGVAMGAAGSDAAIEAADVALMADDLEKLEEALAIGRRVLAISRQNIVFSLLILVILIPSALVGLLSVAAAVFTHETSELLAVANGLRARR